MRNLKRALSLALAAAMLIGMMVVGASAVSYNDFSDSEEIVNKDAVSMLTTLGVINGKEDGSYFDPTGNVTRAEMAKMISVMLSNNENCDDLYMTVNSGLTDIANSWARGYINYCYTLDIIAGRGNGTFDPTANVTGVEAAKMLLAALGYEAEIEGLVGTDWDLNTASLAHELGIFRNFTKDVNAPLNRDDAALLIYNTMDVEMIQQYQNGYALTYLDHRTILSSVFGVIRVEGVVVANEWARLEETDSDAALRTGKTTLENVVWYDSTTANTVVDEGIRETAPVTFNVTTPVEFMGQAVTMYVEKTTILSNSKVIGVATNDELNVIVSTADGADTDDDLLDGTGVELDRDTEFYVNYGYCDDAAEAAELINDYQWYQNDANRGGFFALNGIEVDVIDNDDDGFAEYVLYTQETLSQVIRYNTRDEVVSFYESNVGADRLYDSDTPESVRIDFEDTVIADGDELAEDDLILYVQYGGRTYIKLADIVTGTMTRVDRDRAGELYITIDGGDEYYESFIRDEASDVDVDIVNFDVEDARDEPGFDTLYDFILDSNGFIVAIRPAEEVVVNYALVLDSAWTQNALTRSGEIEILAADGTTGTYDIDWNDSREAMDDIAIGDYAVGGDDTNATLNDKLEAYLGSRDVQQGDEDDDLEETYRTGRAAGSLIAYSLDDNDVLTIERIYQGNTFVNGSLVDIDNTGTEDTTAGVGDNHNIVFANTANYDPDNFEDGHGNEPCRMQYEVDEGGYTNGSGSITVRSTTNEDQSKTYAVDRNTIAFYYWGDGDYAVLTGWNEMSTVVEGTHVQVYPVLTKTNDDTYEASNLAGVLVFEAATEANNDDYLLVLNRNAYTTGDTLWLNVVFEDGTVAEIEVDDADGEDFEDNADFMRAYSYVQNSDGTYDLEDAGDLDSNPANNVIQVAADNDSIRGIYADLLRVGTVSYGIGPDSTDDADATYVAYSEDDANVWDVTGVSDDEDEVVAGDFRVNVEVHAVIVMDDNAIRTAWIWDVEEAPDAPVVNDDYYLTIDTIVPGVNNTTNVTVTLRDADTDQGVGGEDVDYTYVVEILSANGNWVEAMTGDGETTTSNAVGTEGQAVVPIRFDSNDRANSYRVTVTFENSDIGTVSETQVGA